MNMSFKLTNYSNISKFNQKSQAVHCCVWHYNVRQIKFMVQIMWHNLCHVSFKAHEMRIFNLEYDAMPLRLPVYEFK